MRALKNRLLDIYKQKRDVVEFSTDSETEEIPFNIHVTVEDLIIEEEEQDIVRAKVEQLLESLTDRQREIIYLRYSQDCDYEEIAQLMHITVPACRKLFHKAIIKLRKIHIPPFYCLFCSIEYFFQKVGYKKIVHRLYL